MAKKVKTDIKKKIKESTGERVLKIPILDIFLNPKQPRRTFDSESLKNLSDSIKQYGVLQPLVVTKVEGGYELIAGERRLRASRMAGLTEVPAIIKENDYDDQKKLELALIENIQIRPVHQRHCPFARLKHSIKGICLRFAELPVPVFRA